MDLIRNTLSNVAKREYNFVNRSNWMVILEPLLQNVSKIIQNYLERRHNYLSMGRRH